MPVYTKKELPQGQDLILDPSVPFKHIAQYSHSLEANFSFIDAFNTRDKPANISRRARMGIVSDGAYSSAYEVDVFAADTFSDEPERQRRHKDVTLKMDSAATERIHPA